MLKKLSITAFFALVCITALSSNALACACCAEPGTYSVSTGKMASYDLDLLKDMKFGKAANLYTTPASYDDIKGIAEVIKEFEKTSEGEFDLVDAFTGSAWTLQFMTEGEQKGSLVLPRPTMMTSRRVHIPDNTSNSPNVVLYKEWIFSGRVSRGTGFFKRGIVTPATKYTLLFQGHGNNCDNAEDFTNWRLEINGPKADFAFFGKMKAADMKTAHAANHGYGFSLNITN
ncbi:MAG TPA: hypothetical protein PLP21_19045 [Pyrinomonadaceae bacterium]|nr:hypothetical protein [Pyrinomonadaceae bacterium]